jgi:hypothetical protein
VDSIQESILSGILMELKARVYPESSSSTRNRVVSAIGVASYILGNANQRIICAMDVASWDTSFGIATRPKGIVLVHLEGNNGRTKVTRNH